MESQIIAEYGTWFLVLAFVFGLYMTWGIGANDVGNAMGTSVGSGAITVKQAVIIAGIFEFAGAFLAGGTVAGTIKSGIIDPAVLASTPHLLIYGMLASLLASGIWLMVASGRGWPVSTTHTIVGALVGFGVAGIGMHAVKWGGLGEIVASWFISPVTGGIIALVLMLSVRKLVFETDDPFGNAKKWAPFYVFLVGYIVALVTISKGLKNFNLHFSTLEEQIGSIAAGIVCAILGTILVNKVKVDNKADKSFHYASVEKVFTPMMVFTAAAMSFAHGSNDVANGIGPIAAVLSLVDTGTLASKAPVPWWVLLVGGIAIVVGLATYGYKVMETIGSKITELTPSRGYCATLASSATVIVASGLGMPVSTTHIAVGAVMGVGLARGIGALDLRVLGNIVLSWFITLPVGAALAAIFFYILKAIFGG
ncbi:MAG: inorganic phosphate transporter [Chromatiaceae bacterium]|nr:inorganic phosphate transporter [Chromatiaceae bacterium]